MSKNGRLRVLYSYLPAFSTLCSADDKCILQCQTMQLILLGFEFCCLNTIEYITLYYVYCLANWHFARNNNITRKCYQFILNHFCMKNVMAGNVTFFYDVTLLHRLCVCSSTPWRCSGAYVKSNNIFDRED